MKELHIIESETPGVTRSKVKVEKIIKHFAIDLDIELGDFSSLEIEKQKGWYRGHKILRIYRSSWKEDEYFVRHFM